MAYKFYPDENVQVFVQACVKDFYRVLPKEQGRIDATYSELGTPAERRKLAHDTALELVVLRAARQLGLE